MYILQFDGMLCSRSLEHIQPQELLGFGWLIQKNGIEIAHGFGIYACRDSVGSSFAEYLALLEGLEALTDLQIWGETIEVQGDAKCVIDQMLGIASVSSLPLRNLYRHAQAMTQRFHSLTWVWMPRNKNKQADMLSRRGLRYLNHSSPARVAPNKESMIPLVDLRVHSHPI